MKRGRGGEGFVGKNTKKEKRKKLKKKIFSRARARAEIFDVLKNVYGVLMKIVAVSRYISTI